MPTPLAEHINLLVCPVCHARLALTAATVDCTGCGRRFPIVDDLPVLIASRAILPETGEPSASP